MAKDGRADLPRVHTSSLCPDVDYRFHDFNKSSGALESINRTWRWNVAQPRPSLDTLIINRRWTVTPERQFTDRKWNVREPRFASANSRKIQTRRVCAIGRSRTCFPVYINYSCSRFLIMSTGILRPVLFRHWTGKKKVAIERHLRPCRGDSRKRAYAIAMDDRRVLWASVISTANCAMRASQSRIARMAIALTYGWLRLRTRDNRAVVRDSFLPGDPRSEISCLVVSRVRNCQINWNVVPGGSRWRQYEFSSLCVIRSFTNAASFTVKDFQKKPYGCEKFRCNCRVDRRSDSRASLSSFSSSDFINTQYLDKK